MRILLCTHSAATRTSLGIVCRQIWTRLREADPSIEIVQHGWFHHPLAEEVPWEIVGTRCPTLSPDEKGVAPILEDCYGDLSFPEVASRFRPDAVWHLGDPYMGTAVVDERKRLGYKLLYCYPVGEEPINPFDEQGMAKLVASDRLIAPSRFGVEVLEALPALQGKAIHCIPHGVDVSNFRPLPASVRARLRQEIGEGRITGDTRVLGWVGHDQVRKQVWILFALLHYLRSGEWIRCLRCDRITVMEYDPLRRGPRDLRRLRTYEPGYDYRRCWYCRSPDLARGEPRDRIVFWSVMDNNLAVGYDLRHLAHLYGVEDIVFHSSSTRGEAGHTFEEMNLLYNCFDLLLYPSGAEGFGLPVLEAMAAGVPVVYSNYSAHAEMAVGLPVRVGFTPDHPHPSMMAGVDLGDLLKQVLRLLDDTDLRQRLGQETVHRAETFSWDRATPAWLDLLRNLG